MKACENCGHATVCIEAQIGKVCKEWMPIFSPEEIELNRKIVGYTKMLSQHYESLNEKLRSWIE